MGTISRGSAIILAAVLTAVLAMADWFTGADLRIGPVYVVPVVLAAWSAGTAWGLGFAALAGAALLAAGVARDHAAPYPLHFYFDVLGTTAILGIVAVLAGRLCAARADARALGARDAMTGAVSRRGLEDALAHEIDRQRRFGRSFCLVYFECDDFGAVTGRHGAVAGDALLRSVASTLMARVRATDTIARAGACTFALILPETGRNDAMLVLADLRERLDAAVAETHPTATFSVGLAVFDRPPESVEAALAAADRMIAESKRAGPSSVRVAEH